MDYVTGVERSYVVGIVYAVNLGSRKLDFCFLDVITLIHKPHEGGSGRRKERKKRKNKHFAYAVVLCLLNFPAFSRLSKFPRWFRISGSSDFTR